MLAWPFAVASLPVAFAVADATGVRPLGGLVLAGLAGAAVLASDADRTRTVAWVGVLVGSFVGSHLLADRLGAWGAVSAVTAITGAAGYLLLDRRALRRAAAH